jgi:hypothetical protein
VAAAVVVVLAFAPRQGETDTPVVVNPPQAAAEPTARDDKATAAGAPDADKPTNPPPRDPLDVPPPTSLSAAEEAEVNKAIGRGLEYLKRHAPRDPMGNQRTSGLHPLVGLTLLECGVPADDPALARLTALVRADAPRLTETYSLSLAILFLDRLGEAQDEKLVGLLAARLLAGQNEAGGWHYTCPALSEADGQLLLSYLAGQPPSRAGTAPGDSDMPRRIRPDEKPAGDGGGASRAAPPSRDGLPGSVKNRAVVAADPRKKFPRSANDDNSNTQFAVLGVWAARRHGVPVDRCVALIAARFRQSQNADGSWGYNLNSSNRRDSMTCAGLLGLAVGRAGDGPPESAGQDPAIAKGLQFLGRKVQQPGGVKPPQKGRPNGLGVGAEALGDLYWLWSVERVGVIYSLSTIGGKDWYAWGAGLLVGRQGDDGSWSAGQGPLVDTCFALLFLRRVNVARDLTRQLQMAGRVRDPGAGTDER